jgi:hypothetical protein
MWRTRFWLLFLPCHRPTGNGAQFAGEKTAVTVRWSKRLKSSKLSQMNNDIKIQMEQILERGSASINRIKQTSQNCYTKVMWNVALQCLKVIVTKYRCDSSVIAFE